MTTIAHITDLHIADPRHDVTLDDGHRLVDAILADDIDVVVDTGDVVGGGLFDEYQQALEVTIRLAESDVDYLVGPGNHDLSYPQGSGPTDNMRDNWEWYHAQVGSHFRAYEAWPHAVTYDDCIIVMLDTCASGTALARGVVGDAQINTLHTIVADADRPVILAGHHCPSADARGLDWSLALTDRDEIGEALEQAGGVDGWLTGHLHQTCEWSGVFGAEYLLASDMSTAAGGYRRLWWDGGLRWEWRSVRCN